MDKRVCIYRHIIVRDDEINTDMDGKSLLIEWLRRIE